MKNFRELSVGEIVSLNIGYAKVFQSHGVDFCCGGELPLGEACQRASVSPQRVVADLESISESMEISPALNFDSWPLDLVIDYLFKFHHRYIRTEGPRIETLLDKVCNAHGGTDRHLLQVRELFRNSLVDLHSHLEKEESILFPYIREIMQAEASGVTLPDFHCGNIENPIRVMMMEHDSEGERFREISQLTNAYQPPAHACNSYRLLLNELRQFEEFLHIHIHVENNILFPKSIRMQDKQNAI